MRVKNELRLKLYGPRLKLMAERDGSAFTMLLDEFDDETDESKIVTIEVPRGQLEEWTAAFMKTLESTSKPLTSPEN